ncbi:MAG: hypothetical protein ACOC28_07290 [Alkalispirochaetaceae bacterium]
MRTRERPARRLGAALQQLLLIGLLPLLIGCYLVPYDEDAVAGALLARELTELAVVGPGGIEFAEDEPPTGEFFPYLGFGSGGYMTQVSGDTLSIYHFTASGAEQILSTNFETEQTVDPYAAWAVGTGSVGATPPLFVAEANQYFNNLSAWDPTGLVNETALPPLLSAEFGGEDPNIVGLHFWSEPDGTDVMGVLARRNDASSFKEARFTLNGNGTVSAPTYPAGGIFNLPNLTDDILIYNGSLVVDPDNGLTYFTVQDDENLITYRWSTSDPPATLATITLAGAAQYVRINGTLIARAGSELIEYDSDGGEINRWNAGSVRAIGRYWSGSSVVELLTAVGTASGIPDPSATATLYAW